MQKLLQHAPLAVDRPKYTDPHTKVNALVQVGGAEGGAQEGGGQGGPARRDRRYARGSEQRSPPVAVGTAGACCLFACAISTPLPLHPSMQAHLSRTALNPDMGADARRVVGQATRLLQAMVDVISSSGWLNPALAGQAGG